jgi:hypothetical protein
MDLAMVLVAIQAFGDRWLFAEGEQPLRWRHLDCGELTTPVQCCDHCGKPVRPGDALPVRGPGFADEQAPELGAAIDRFAGLYA